LLIDNIKGQDILPYIKEYIMKKKRIEYLAIVDSYYFESTSDNDKELFSLKEEVEEFELYNIKIQRYNDLLIHACYDIMFIS
jgi:hypothetical protein